MRTTSEADPGAGHGGVPVRPAAETVAPGARPGDGAPTVSVVISAYTEARVASLLEAVASVRRQTRPADRIVVVVDHNDRLLARLRAELPDLVVVPNGGPRGLSGARNSGVAAASGDVVAFVDDDALAEPDWLERLARPYETPEVVGVGGAIEPLWTAGAAPRWFPDEFLWVVGCTYRGVTTTAGPVGKLIGCNMSFRRDVLTGVGGFRIGRVGTLSIGREGDETEVCIRLALQRPGARLWYDPAARVHHRVDGNRVRFSYFCRRCLSEGLSKARLSRAFGSAVALDAERRYVRTLLRGLVRDGVRAVARRDLEAAWRAGTIVAGSAVVSTGLLAAFVGLRVTGTRGWDATPGS